MPTCELDMIDESVVPGCQELEAGPERPPATILARHLLWIAPALLAFACLMVGFFLRGVGPAPKPIQPLLFGLQARQYGEKISLTWNPAAEAVRRATRATLTIQDGPESADLELNRAALDHGGLWYDPLYKNVSFRLRLAHPSRRTVGEEAHLAVNR